MEQSGVLLAFLAILALGCSDEPGAQPEGDAVRVTLRSTEPTTRGPGFAIASRQVLPGGQDDPNADFYLGMTMVVALFPTTLEGGFCEQSTPDLTFSRVEDIPVDAATCPADWGSGMLFGNYVHDTSVAAGRGFLVRDRAGTTRGSLMIVSDLVQIGLTEIVFDFLPLAP